MREGIVFDAQRLLQRATLFGALSILASGCVGGGARAVPAPSASTASVSSAKQAKFVLTIPPKINVSTSRRAPRYVSASTLSGVLVVNATTYYLNLSNTSSSCSTGPQGGLICNITVPATLGSNTASLTLYNGGYTGTGPSGNPLSSASNFTFSVTEGQSVVTVPLILGGVPWTATYTMTQQPAPYNVPSYGRLIVTAQDASGNTIVGPGGYNDANGNPVTFTLTAPSTLLLSTNGGSTTASTVTIGDPTTVVTVVVPASGTTGGEIAVTAPSTVTLAPNAVYVSETYNELDYDEVDADFSTSGPLQGAVTGVISGSSGDTEFTVSGLNAVGCIGANTASDTIGLAYNSPGNLLGIIAANIYNATSFSLSGTAACNTSGPLSIESGNAVTMTYVQSGPLAGRVLAVQQSGSQCDLYQQPLAGGAYGPFTATFSCPTTVPWDLSYDQGVAPVHYAAFGLTQASDVVGYFSDISGTVSFTPALANAGQLGGVAIRDGVIYAINSSTASVEEFNIANSTLNSVSLQNVSTSCIFTAAVATRTFVIGEDGNGYLAVGNSCGDSAGVDEFSLSTGAQIAVFDSDNQATSVASDLQGHIYFTDYASLYRIPSVTDLSLSARRRTRRR